MNRTGLISVALSFAAGVAVGPWVAPSVQAQYRAVKTTSLMRTDLGAWCEGKEVTVEIQEYGPGTSGMHYHPAHSFAWLIEGSEVKVVQGKQPVNAKAGEVLYEGPMEVHETHNDAPAKVLLLRIAEKGKPVSTRVR